MNLCCPLGLFLTLVHWVLKLGGKHQEMVGLVPGRSSASVEALCRVSVTSQTSSTGLAHVETLTWPPTTEKPWQGQIGRRGWERERKLCVSVWMCVCWVQERKNFFHVSSYCSQNKSSIRANDAPQRALSCFPPLLLPTWLIFIHTSPSSLSCFSHFFAQRSPSLGRLSNNPAQKWNTGRVPFFKNGRFLQENNALILFCSLLPSVLCSLPYLLRGTLTLFTISAANFPPYPSPYLQ